MPNLEDLYSLNTAYLMGGFSAWTVVAGVLALIGACAAAYFFLRQPNRGQYTGWMKRIAAHVNFDRYIIPMILKFLYVFSVLYAVLNGLVTLFATSFWAGLLMIVLGPIGVRIAYELIMMLFSIHDNILETNRLLRGGAQPRSAVQPQPQQAQQPQYVRPAHRADGQGSPETPPEQPRHYPGGYDPMNRG